MDEIALVQLMDEIVREWYQTTILELAIVRLNFDEFWAVYSDCLLYHINDESNGITETCTHYQCGHMSFMSCVQESVNTIS